MSFLIEKREVEDDYAKMQTLLNGGSLDAVEVTRENVMNIGAVSASMELITGLLSSLDFKLYKKVSDNKIEKIEDSRLFLLNNEPNTLINSIQLKKCLIEDMILDGIGFINIEKSLNTIKNLYYVDSKEVMITMDNEAIHKNADVSVRGKKYELFDFIVATLNVKNGLTGNGILKRNKELLALALLQQAYINKIYKSGGGRKGIWKSEKKLGIDEFAQFKLDAKDIQETDANIVLNDKVTYTPLTNTNRDMQMLEARDQLNNEIREMFNIPKVMDEEGFKSFVKVKLNPIVNSLESAVNKALLLENEKLDGYFFKLDLYELTKADIITRYNAYKLALDSGFTSINEVRLEENKEPINNMNVYKVSIGSALYNADTDTYFMPNMNSTMDANGKVVNQGVEESTSVSNNKEETAKDKTTEENTTTEKDNSEK